MTPQATASTPAKKKRRKRAPNLANQAFQPSENPVKFVLQIKLAVENSSLDTKELKDCATAKVEIPDYKDSELT